MPEHTPFCVDTGANRYERRRGSWFINGDEVTHEVLLAQLDEAADLASPRELASGEMHLRDRADGSARELEPPRSAQRAGPPAYAGPSEHRVAYWVRTRPKPQEPPLVVYTGDVERARCWTVDTAELICTVLNRSLG